MAHRDLCAWMATGARLHLVPAGFDHVGAGNPCARAGVVDRRLLIVIAARDDDLPVRERRDAWEQVQDDEYKAKMAAVRRRSYIC